ncbi:type B chloramphenicol O-acetyltransferase [Aureimonas fodinaquatilis]|uniref:Chloramphenicol acetyltransferase n=1 Tax=Aureimonas fodinaquatilis TaxID=2565783 RepID=A0A5B0DVD1_9HYPH|nr:type B chloramphenicol O-acetyltransferase [Aureimonas fodinaquatilis]KAA0970353.1 type B chloramphenicol O-acetyltransferase [Aureimonas fodinaquatilis]
MTNYFESPFKGIPLDQQVSHPNIVVGRYSYYSGYYHRHSFEDCARYILPQEDADRLVIGSFCSIGSGAAFIMAGNQGHRTEWASTFPFFYVPESPEFAGAHDGYKPSGDTVIGNDVWIGSEAIVMPGVQVGHGAVIGTRAVVTRNVEPYAIVVGNPGKPLRKRFGEPQIAMLLEMAWWDWTDDQRQSAMPLLTSGDIDGLYRHWQAQ